MGIKLPLHLQRGGCAEIFLKKPTHSDQRKFFLGSLLFGSIGEGVDKKLPMSTRVSDLGLTGMHVRVCMKVCVCRVSLTP